MTAHEGRPGEIPGDAGIMNIMKMVIMMQPKTRLVCVRDRPRLYGERIPRTGNKTSGYNCRGKIGIASVIHQTTIRPVTAIASFGRKGERHRIQRK